MVKRLKYIGQCLEELSSLGVIGTEDTNPSSSFGNNASISGEDSREVSSSGSARGAGLSLLRPSLSAEAVQAGRKFQQQFLWELPSLMVLPGEALRHHLSW